MFVDHVDTKLYDVAIIGSGPAGITTALRVAELTDARIILVESGGLEVNEQISQLSQVEASGDRSSNYYPGHAQRVLGGTSNVWTGFCTMLEERSFINGEWPIQYGEIEPYYKDAAAILELPQQAYALPSKSIGPQNEIIYKPFFVSSPVRFKEKYGDYLRDSEQIDVLLNHTCVDMVHNGRIETILLRNSTDPAAPPQSVQATHIVLACGGLGNPRLLQLSRIANNSPTGNYLMGHPHIYGAGEIELDHSLLDSILYQDDSIRVAHALQLDDSFCVENNLLNFSVAFGVNEIQERLLLGKKTLVYVSQTTVRAEMPPDIKNRVYLGETQDYLEQPITKIDFTYNYQQLAHDSWTTFAKAVVRNGLGRASTPLEFFEINGGGHYVGTTRLGHSPDNSVADANCKVHEIENLYLAGSSIFPASTAANPTFSIVAFAVRLAEHLSTLLLENE